MSGETFDLLSSYEFWSWLKKGPLTDKYQTILDSYLVKTRKRVIRKVVRHRIASRLP